MAPLLALLLFVLGIGPEANGGEAVSFNRDIRSILTDNCFGCHGPDGEARKADLRLDSRDGAGEVLAPGGELLARIGADDPDDVMPPPESNKSLDPEEIERLRQWIAEGAKYERHWALVPPIRPEAPEISDKDWPKNPIDRFVLARLEEQGLAPSAEADRYTLAVRAYLDLIGLPPTPEQADAFVADDDPRAYENLVDELLESPRYGERWARSWLDLARYSDTNGYEKDRPRSIWPYRDWVVKALNDDMPFDQFSIEQIAGDMLPNATVEQRIATGFHRNTMLNEEGGIDPLEYRFYAMVDRVATTGAVWLGMTTGCAQCHTHKFDPITHTDYYRLMALLDNADEPDLEIPDPKIARIRARKEARIESIEQEALDTISRTRFRKWLARERERAMPWTVIEPVEMESNLPRLELLEDGSVFASGDFTKRDVFTLRFRVGELNGSEITAIRLEALPDPRLPGHGPGRSYYEGPKGDFFLSEVTARSSAKKVEFSSGSYSYGKISVGGGDAAAANVFDGDGSTGWSTSGREGERSVLVLNLKTPLEAPADLEIELLFERHFPAALGRFRVSVTTSAREAKARYGDARYLDEARPRELRLRYVRTAGRYEDVQDKIASLRESMPALPTTLVMQERPPDHRRETFRRHRGEYLNAREAVTPGLPEALVPAQADQPANRLELARWLVGESNPLVARVTVNRAWHAFFGRGIVIDTADFGVQSSPPAHPDLLDWLAAEFVDGGWSMKRLHRMIATSATYRQSSRVTPEMLARDPSNELLARGPRFRVDAETVRDAALASSGLLSAKMGGPGVYPPQPASVTALAYGATKWETSEGEDRFRRSLYTFSKRTAPFAAYTVFDAPSGETCVARRDRANTPLQALTLLNDAMFVEMARALAEMSIEEAESNRERAVFIFRRCLIRYPTGDERKELLAFYRAQLKRLESGELKAEEILSDSSDDSQLAAWTLVARAVLNFDETITKG